MVSVVILGYRNNQSYNKLLTSLKDQSYQDFEILWATEKGVVKAMNIALNNAKGDIFVRIDEDVELTHDWLKELVEPFQDPLVAGVTGPTFVPRDRWKNRDSIQAASSPNWFLSRMFDNDLFAPAKIYKCGSVSYGSNFYVSPYREYKIDHLEGTNWAMRTKLIRQVGGFDPKFDGVAEWYDTDVEFKIKNLGYKLVYNPKAVLWHLLEKGAHFGERYDGVGRIKNWLRFHWRHSDFHYKKIIWLLMMGAYFVKQSFCKSIRH